MSIKQLKDVINDIFIEKFKHDQRCLEARAQVETMEQFLYTYLSKKYGLKVSLNSFIILKSLILSQASLVVSSVKAYLRLDADVSLFAKCLKNECDQEFRSVQAIARD